MERKSDKVRRLVAGGSFKEALSIAKDFRMGISKAESDAMTLAYECMVHDRFYKTLGYDLDEKIKQGIAVLTRLYGKSEDNDIYQQIQQPRTKNRKVHCCRYNAGSAEVPA